MAIRLETVNRSDAQVILWVRVSTDHQEIESMKKDLVGLAKADGFSESQMIVIGSAGASARSLNALYLADFNKLLNACDNPNVVEVYAWEVSRLARHELPFYQFKQKLMDNGIQLHIYSGGYKLFKDGKLDSGIELVFSVLATAARQEMELKMERFERGRERNRQEGKYNGNANGCCFGYRVGEDKKFIADEQEKELVELIFTLYATGDYSHTTLANELNKRGYKCRSGRISYDFVGRVLVNTTYIGYKTRTYKNGKTYTVKYPPIISQTLFERCQAIAQSNDANKGRITRQSKHISLANKILKCKECGGNFMLLAIGKSYACYSATEGKRRNSNACSCSNSINAAAMDNILWTVAGFYYLIDLSTGGSLKQTQLKEDLKVLRQKLDVATTELEALQERKEKLDNDYYIEGKYSETRYIELSGGQQIKEDSLKSNIVELEQQIADKELMLQERPNYFITLNKATQAEKRQLCLTYVDKAYIQPVSGQKKTDVEIYAKDGGKYLFRYDYYKRKGQPYQLIFAQAGEMLTGQQSVLRTYALEQAVQTGFTADELNDFVKILKATIHKPTGNKFFDDMVGQYAESKVELTKEEIEFIEGSGFTLEEYNRWVEEQEEIADKAEDPID